MLVEQAEGHQEQAALDRGPVGQLVVDVELLDLEFALVAGGSDGVLGFELGIEHSAVVEAVADAEHRARQVGLGVLRLVHRVRVVDLAIAPQAEVFGDAAVRLGGFRHLLHLHRLLLLLRGQGLVLRLQLVELGLEGLQLLLHGVDLLLQLLCSGVVDARRIGGAGGARGQQGGGGQAEGEIFLHGLVHGGLQGVETAAWHCAGRTWAAGLAGS